jgi:molecular chaperone HscC
LIIGIDLGTTHSLAAVWRDGKPVLIPNALGENLTPSCVSVDEDGSILIGRAARERLQTHPQMTAALFKRYMGSAKKYRLGQTEYRPEELSSLVSHSHIFDAKGMNLDDVRMLTFLAKCPPLPPLLGDPPSLVPPAHQ